MGQRLSPIGPFTPPANDQANAVLTGVINALGTTAPFECYVSFHINLTRVEATPLTTHAVKGNATVGSYAGLAVGQFVTSVNVPPGTTIATLPGAPNITLNFMPGAGGAAAVAAGVDNNAHLGGAAWNAIVQLERTYDGGKTWQVAGVGGAGQGAIYTGNNLAGQPVDVIASECEKGVSYRFNCTNYVSGTINYRFSASGLAAMPWGVPPS